MINLASAVLTALHPQMPIVNPRIILYQGMNERENRNWKIDDLLKSVEDCRESYVNAICFVQDFIVHVHFNLTETLCLF